MNWTELNALLKFEISATRNCKRVTAVCGLRFAVYLMLKVSINTPISDMIAYHVIAAWKLNFNIFKATTFTMFHQGPSIESLRSEFAANL